MRTFALPMQKVVSRDRRDTLSWKAEMEWMRWSGDMFEVLMQWRRRSCGSAGGVGSR